MRFKRVIYMTSMNDPMKRVVNTRIENNTLFSNKILSSLRSPDHSFPFTSTLLLVPWS